MPKSAFHNFEEKYVNNINRIESKLINKVVQHPVQAVLLTLYLPSMYQQLGYLLSEFPIDDRAFWFLSSDTVTAWVVEAAVIYLWFCDDSLSGVRAAPRLFLAWLLYLGSSLGCVFIPWVISRPECCTFNQFMIIFFQLLYFLILLYPVIVLLMMLGKGDSNKGIMDAGEHCIDVREQDADTLARVKDGDNSDYILIVLLLATVPTSALVSTIIDGAISLSRYQAIVSTLCSFLRVIYGLGWCVLCILAALIVLCLFVSLFKK